MENNAANLEDRNCSYNHPFFIFAFLALNMSKIDKSICKNKLMVLSYFEPIQGFLIHKEWNQTSFSLKM